MNIVAVICIIGIIVRLVGLYRGELVYRCRIKAIDIVLERTTKAIVASDYDWKRFYLIERSYGSYDYMVFHQLTKWSFEGFYPGLKEALK